jgi:iron(II)-dependent oxidoreductase
MRFPRIQIALPRSAARWAIAAIATVVFFCGLWWHHAVLLGSGAVILCLVLRRVTSEEEHADPWNTQHRRRTMERRAAGKPSADKAVEPTDQEPQTPPRVATRIAHHCLPNSTDALVDEMLASSRYSLLLRPETKRHLTQTHIVRAIRQLDEEMALVPAGRVLLGQLAEQSHSACGWADIDERLAERNLVEVAPAYLDRYCVTNEQYQRFVDSGGYEQLEFWQEEALPALLDFVDQTGMPGPRYWSDGQYASGEGRLPVVGVSWYEAWAYARWVGKRLPTDAEWTKAGAWPVESTPGRIAQRRYPWGESFDTRRAHVYGCGIDAPVAVDDYPTGCSVGGIHQLIGNVWEWTATPLAELGDPTLHISESIISIRGGAYDTYFENQATCHYQSGEHPLSRRPNIGFRLALPMADLEVVEEDDAPQDVVDEPVAAVSSAHDAALAC